MKVFKFDRVIRKIEMSNGQLVIEAQSVVID